MVNQWNNFYSYISILEIFLIIMLLFVSESQESSLGELVSKALLFMMYSLRDKCYMFYSTESIKYEYSGVAIWVLAFFSLFARSHNLTGRQNKKSYCIDINQNIVILSFNSGNIWSSDNQKST